MSRRVRRHLLASSWARRVVRAAVSLVIGIALGPARASASYLETLGLGSRAISLGNAFVAVADDPSANYYNPAGLTQLIGGPRADFSVGANITGIRLQYREPIVDDLSGVRAGQTVHMDHDFPDFIPQPFFPSGFELGERFYLVPFALQTPFAGTTQWPSTFGDARFSAAEGGQLFITWSPTLGMRVNEWLAVGAGFDLVIADDLWQKAVFGDGALGRSVSTSLTGQPDSVITPFVKTANGVDDGYTLLRAAQRFPTGISPVNDVDLDFRTPGFRVGVMVFPNEWLRIGAAYRSKLEPTVQGSIETHWEEAILDHPIYRAAGVTDDREHFHLEFPLPQRVAFGMSARVTDRWMVTAEYDFTDWAHARVVDNIRMVSGGLNDNLLTPNGVRLIQIGRHPRSTHAARTGVEWKPLDPLVLTAGFWYDPTPVRDKYYEFGSDPGTRFLYSWGVQLVGLAGGLLDVGSHVQYADVVERHLAVGESVLAGGSRNIGVPDDNGVSSGNFGPNDTFSVVTGGHILNWGFLVTVHY